MKKILYAMAMTTVVAGAVSAQNKVKPCIPVDPVVEQKVEQTLAKMSLDEKIGQMCEITIDVVTDFSSPNDFKLSTAKLDTIIGKYKVGSLLNVPLSLAQTKEKWAEAIRQIQKKSLATLGIPCIYGVDQIHGTTYTLGGTLFPQPINQAASFDRSIPHRVSEVSAYESKAGCIPWVYAPVMDFLFFIMSFAVPTATTSPPCSPAPGPISTIQSAANIVSSSCSTTITELPRSLR